MLTNYIKFVANLFSHEAAQLSQKIAKNILELNF